MTYEHIVAETRERVGLVRLNRPQRMNALNDALAVELKDALERFDADDAIAAIVITGNDKAFAAGADIGAMAEWDYAKVYHDNYITRDWEHVRHVRKPVIAAVVRLRARRRLRARDGLRPHHRGGHGEIRPARDHDRHDAGNGRHAAAAARRGQGEGDGLVPDGPDDRRRRGRAERARRARRGGRQGRGGGARGRREDRRASRCRSCSRSRRRSTARTSRRWPRACCSSGASFTRPSRSTTRRRGCGRSSRRGSRCSSIADKPPP